MPYKADFDRYPSYRSMQFGELPSHQNSSTTTSDLLTGDKIKSSGRCTVKNNSLGTEHMLQAARRIAVYCLEKSSLFDRTQVPMKSVRILPPVNNIKFPAGNGSYIWQRPMRLAWFNLHIVVVRGCSKRVTYSRKDLHSWEQSVNDEPQDTRDR